MGLDVVYQAFPSERKWWNRILADKQCKEDIVLLPYYISGSIDPRNSKLSGVVSDLLQERPDIEERYVYYDHLWDCLHYLLSDKRRQNLSEYRADIGTKAVRGALSIGPDVIGRQDMPVRYTPHKMVPQVVTFMESLSDADVLEHYDPVRMQEIGVYKVWAKDKEDDSNIRIILDYFHALRRLYSDAAAHNECVLVCIE